MHKKQKTELARLHGELICHFANASSAKEALSGLYSDAEKAQGWPGFAKAAQKLLTRHLKSIQSDAGILESIQEAKDFLSRKVRVSLPPYAFGDCMMGLAPLVPQFFLDDKLGPYWAILGCSMVRFSEMEGWKKLICECEHCGIFLLTKTVKGSKFCSDKCKNDFHNRRRIESGEAREYKRRRRAEGLDQ